MKTKPYVECDFLRISNGRQVCTFGARDQIDYCTMIDCPIRDKSSKEFRVIDLQWIDDARSDLEHIRDMHVNHPPHYCNHPSGLECIQVTQHFNFNRGNAIKYIWRAGQKGDEVEDLKKAIKYLQFEIERVENGSK